jgi:16S rRNA processing protein RimM
MTVTDWIEIGRIVAPQGLKGEVRIYPSSDFPERFLEPGPRWVQRPQAPTPEPVQLVGGRLIEGKGLYVVQLEGIRDRTQAESLRGCTLLVPASDRPDLDEGEFYGADLIGLRVILQATGEEIGRVTDIYEAGNDLLEVTYPSNPDDGAAGSAQKPKKVLVPFVESIVPLVDLEQGYLHLDPPPGLLEG